MLRRMIVMMVSLSLLAGPVTAASQAPTVFKKLDFYTQEGEEMKDHDAQLIIDAQRRLFIFADEDHANEVFATVPWDRVTGVTYENSKHARITAGLLIAWPMLFLKGKKHWLTVTYGPANDGTAGGYAFARMDKDNFQTILAAINGYTGYEIRRIEENGEVSVLYPGTQGATQPRDPYAPPSSSSSGAVPASTSPTPDNSVPAGALPPAGDDAIPAAPLPSRATPNPLVLVNKGVQWTDRSASAVGFVWAAEVRNDNDVDVDTTVVLRLFDAQGAVLHEARQRLTATGAQLSSFTANGEVPEADALRADRWEFDLEESEPVTPATADPTAPAAGATTAGPPAIPGSPPGATPSNATAGSATPTALMEPVPLTEDMVKPELVRESVTIVSDNPAIQGIHFEQVQITIRCLIRADGSVADARVFRLAPDITSPATEAGIKEAIAASAINYWRFTPAMKDGVAVPVWSMVTVEYTSGRGGD
jgi:hypothetical protein